MPDYIPIPFTAPSPESEIIGQILLGWFLEDGLYEDIEPILKKHGLDSIEPAHWYPMQKVLHFFLDICGRRENVAIDLVAVGMNTTEIVLPPGVQGIPEAIQLTNEAVQKSCKNIPADFGYQLTVFGPAPLRVKNN